MRTIDLLEIYDALGLVQQMALTEDPPAIVWMQWLIIVGAANFSLLILARLRTVLLACSWRLRTRTSLVATPPVQILFRLLAQAVQMLL